MIGAGLDRKTRTLAWALLLAGFLFRAWAVGHARFTGDESYFWATARNTATFEARPVYGPSMTGSNAYHPGPLFYYLMAVPQRLGRSPWWGGLFVAGLHALSSALLAALALRARGPRAGLIALALLAFAPWDVLYADRIWLSCVAPVWGALILYAATRLERPWAQGALVFFGLTCPQLHMSAPVVWAAAAVLARGTPRPWRLSRRALAVGGALVLAAYALPLWHELTHEFSNTRAILTEGGGKEAWGDVVFTPVKVLAYAVLSGSAEIGYHFETGYWRAFHEGAAYLSAAGLSAWLARHGPLWAALIALSVLAAAAAWLRGTAHLALGGRDVWRREDSALEGRVTLALWAGLAVAMALMTVARKQFFPHYTNLLMPLLVWPLVMALDAAWSAVRPRAVAAVLALIMLAMGSSAARYYLEIDRRNGLDATLGMVERAMSGPAPFEVSFDGFYNRFAWEMLASTGYKRSLPVGSPPKVRYRVRNAAIGGEAGEGATVHDGVVMEAR